MYHLSLQNRIKLHLSLELLLLVKKPGILVSTSASEESSITHPSVVNCYWRIIHIKINGSTLSFLIDSMVCTNIDKDLLLNIFRL